MLSSKTTIIRLLGMLGLLLQIFQVKAQCQITSETNMFRCGDSIALHKIEYLQPGGVGEEQVWDFRNMEIHENPRFIRFVCDSDSITILGQEPQCFRKYIAHDDTLFMLGYETRLQTMNYEKPFTLLPFPSSYGSYIEQPFHSIGTYSKKYVIESRGTSETEADATGIILFNENDTLRNVLRVHRISSAGIWQYLPGDSIVDTLNVKQRIEDHYLWFARGYRYPVFETISTTIFNDLSPVSCQQVSYCSLPSDQMHLKDSINSQIQDTDSVLYANNLQVPIHYQVAVNGKMVAISYTLETDATIQSLVCDRMGLVYKRNSATGLAGESGQIQINCNGIRSGVYVLYINVNGRVFSEIIEL